MILEVFIKFFGVKIVFTDIYRYFFRNSSTCAREIKSQNFAEISRISDISAIFPIFWLIDYRMVISFRDPSITDILAEKTEILFLE